VLSSVVSSILSVCEHYSVEFDPAFFKVSIIGCDFSFGFHSPQITLLHISIFEYHHKESKKEIKFYNIHENNDDFSIFRRMV
jgi:hypothetical protein